MTRIPPDVAQIFARSGPDVARRLLGILVALAAIIYVLVVGFPGDRFPIESGLDASWTYGINFAADRGLIFGRDVVFTYGPFGYLRSPVNIGANLTKAIAFQLAMHSAFVALLLLILIKTRRFAPMVLWASGFSVSLALGLQYEYQLIAVAALLACASIHLFQNRWMLFSSGAISAFLFFIRPGMGVLALAIVAGLTLVLSPAARKWLGTCAIFTAAGAIAMASLVLIGRFGSVASFMLWLRLTGEVISGFDIAMSDPGSRKEIAFAMAATLVFLFPSISARGRLFRLCVAFAPAVFLCFKHSFVRQDQWHVPVFFAFLVLLTALIQLFLESAKERRIAAAMLVCLILISAALQASEGNFSREQLSDALSGTQGFRKLEAILALKSQLAEFDRISARTLSSDVLPTRWREAIAKEGGTVMPFPIEISICPANQLPCRLYPTLQAYSAYTDTLDRWSSTLFDGPGAPDFLIVEYASIDGRNVWFDVPATWRAVLAHYRLLDSENGRRLLLVKRHAAQPTHAAPLFRTRARIGDWADVPSSESVAMGALRLELSWLGRLAKTLYRSPPVYLEVRYRGGEVSRWRFVPSNAVEGLLLGAVPRTAGELADICAGGGGEPVAQFRVVAPRSELFEREFQLDWSIVQKTAADSGERMP